jgi:hypothetical protein
MAVAGALRLELELPLDHGMAQGTLARIVGRLDALLTQKRPPPNAMFSQLPAHVDDGRLPLPTVKLLWPIMVWGVTPGRYRSRAVTFSCGLLGSNRSTFVGNGWVSSTRQYVRHADNRPVLVLV